jgi:origin recognition complex subunit 1
MAKRARADADGMDTGTRWIGNAVGVSDKQELCYDSVSVCGEEFSVGDAVLVDSGVGDVQWVCKIDALWEDTNGERRMEARWYYTPEECQTGRLPGHDRRELFESVHSDENHVDSINGAATVMNWDEYQHWLQQPAQGDDEDESIFVCRAQYHPGTGEFLPLVGASSLAEAARKRAPQASGAHGAEHGDAAHLRRRKLSRFAEAATRLNPSAAPERMPCREKEREEVTSVLRAAIIDGGLGTSLYLSGTPGTGKTATVHQALRTLAAEPALPPFRTVELNGMKLSSPHQVYT